MTGSVQRTQLGELLGVAGSGESTRFSFGRVPLYSDGNQPFTVAGGAGRGAAPGQFHGSGVPGFAPELGVLGGSALADGVSPVSSVEALPTAAPGTVGLATQLAAPSLALASGAVVRTWVLRRTTG